MNTGQKILIALCELMEGGDRHITRYKIAQLAGVNTGSVYTFFKNLKSLKV